MLFRVVKRIAHA